MGRSAADTIIPKCQSKNNGMTPLVDRVVAADVEAAEMSVHGHAVGSVVGEGPRERKTGI